jgi:hypothetical protein
MPEADRSLSTPARVLHSPGATDCGSILGTPAAIPAVGGFPAAWVAYLPYSDAAACPETDDDAPAEWIAAQCEATAALAEAPARNFTELEAKLAAGLYWFENSSASHCMCAEEADLLRSCLNDLRALKGAVA